VKRGYLPTLDGWRAVAIGLVIADHLSLSATRRPPETMWLGQIGVNLFFGLSGFLITSRLLAERGDEGRVDLGAFYLRRVARILPAAFGYLLVVSLLGVAGVLPVRPLEVVAAAGFFRNYLPPALPLATSALGVWDGFYTSHFWSLAIEEHFYLLWPPLLARLKSVRAVGWAAAALAIAVMLWRGVALFLSVERTGHGIALFTWRTDLRLDALLWGAVVGAAFTFASVQRWLTGRRGQLTWVLAVAAYLLVLYLYRARPTVWGSALVPIMIAGTVARPDGLVGRGLELSAVRWVGRLSYSLYLWQQLWTPFAGVPRTLGRVQLWPMNLAAILLAAAASYYLVERPCIRVGARLVGRWRSARVGEVYSALAGAGD
jgi:peptidoglycan/LPS O-acetylase OafA/YrhL